MQYFSHLLAGLTLLAFTATALPLQDRGLSIEDRAPIEERGTPSENLDKGFSNHIAIQHQQKQDLKGIAATESMKGQTNQNFDGAKNKLINTIEKGVDQRKKNQMYTAQTGDVKTGVGLQGISKIQQTELKQTESLKGQKSADTGTIKTLNTEFTNGIHKNEKLQQGAKTYAANHPGT